MRPFYRRVVVFFFYGGATVSSPRILSRWKKHVAIWLGFLTSVKRVGGGGEGGPAARMSLAAVRTSMIPLAWTSYEIRRAQLPASACHVLPCPGTRNIIVVVVPLWKPGREKKQATRERKKKERKTYINHNQFYDT